MKHLTGWHKCPSVRTGGKAYFYVRRIEDTVYRITWNRYRRAWELTAGDCPVALAYAPTPGALATNARPYARR